MSTTTIFILFSFIIVAKAEKITDLLRSINSSLDIHKGSPKIWQSYIKYILFRITKKTMRLSGERYVLFLRKQLRSTDMFYKYKFLRTYENFVPENRTREHSTLVLAPTGRLVSLYQNSFNCDVMDITDKYYFSWKFHLTPSFRLNFTILTLDFFPESPKTCHREELVFLEAVLHLFCGFYSDVSIYSFSNEILIWMETVRCVYSQLQAQFVVIDTDLITTRKYITIIKSERRPIHLEVLLLKVNSFLETFYIEMKKLYRIILKVVVEVDHVVYDSPQLLHNKLKPNNIYYNLSTFQCMVQVFYDNFSFNYEAHFIHKYSRLQNVLTLNKTYNEPLILQLPTFCEESLCAYLIIQTKPRKQLKIDVTKFSYKGKIDYFCKYGGLAMVEINEQIQERPAICEDDQRNTTKDKIFYSHQSPVMLILYWYEGLSSIEGKVTVTESECRATQVNICEMHFKCMYTHYSLCIEYVRRVSWISGIIFRVVRPLHRRVKLRIAWVVGSKTRCFILNFFSNYLKHYGWPSSQCEVVCCYKSRN